MTFATRAVAAVVTAAFMLAAPAAAHAQISVSVDGTDGDGGGLSSPVALLLLIGLMGVLPAIVIAITAFPRILIVLGFVRQAMGTMTVPPTQVLIALALFLTMFVMMPTVNKVREDAVAPYIAKEISFETAWERGQEPVRSFMFRQTRTEDLALFVRLAKVPRPETRADIPTYVLIPAFMISELKTAFQIGFMIYLPFLIIDMVVASTLLSVGMMMLPPPMISLPFKLLLFVLVNGWHLVIESLVNSFNTS